MEAAGLTAHVGFGELLRQWRARRRVSQLALSLETEISARHLSFVETGRSKPSREVVLRLADTLDVPLRERNALLLSAGYAPVFAEHPYESASMGPIRSALDHFLRAHEPYPALIVDRGHGLVAANDALAAVTEGCSAELLRNEPNAIRIALHPDGMAPRTVNLAEWSAHLLSRLRREAMISGDPALLALYEEACGYPGVSTETPMREQPEHDLFVPLRLQDGDGELVFLSTISTFGSALNVTVSELSVEAFYPANAETAMRMLGAIAGV
jgi:transcriptional regulator with XRE-family HTH domain